ncbi:MAG: hypothetical protein AAGG72_03650 [Pseudomonadota bacterium]
MISLAWLLAALLISPSAQAGWLTRLVKDAGDAGSSVGKFGVKGLDESFDVVRKLPTTPDRLALAATVSPEGHWTFVNRDGDVFTAANREELGRVRQALAPDLATPTKNAGREKAQLAIYLAPETVIATPALLKELPTGAMLHVTVDRKPYRLVPNGARSGGATYETWAIRLRSNLQVRLGPKVATLKNAVWQLNRPLHRADIRVVALDVEGADALLAVPRLNATKKAARVDRLKPDALAASFRDVRGQTVLLKGRLEGREFVFTPSGGRERRLDYAELSARAAESDVNLVVLNTNSTRQPGGRNWFWQPVKVDGLDTALQRATYADFLNTLAEGQGPFRVDYASTSSTRATLIARSQGEAVGDANGIVGDVSEFFGQVVIETTGNVVSEAVTISMNNRARQSELDRRIIPGIPSAYQMLYVAGLVLGFLSWSTLKAWWPYVWRTERRQDFAGSRGYHAARAVEALAFFAVFIPLAGPFAFVWRWLLTIWLWVSWPFVLLGRAISFAVRGFRNLPVSRSGS